ncbi:MAG: DsbA family protein [Legionellales bacterium]|nr:DsbA family protein [Legionellales bacterium]
MKKLISLVLGFMLILSGQVYAEKIQQLLTDLFTPKLTPTSTVVLGNPQGDVSVIEFTDYNCPYCRLMTPVINQLITADKHIRLVVVDYPVVTKTSELAARAALATREQQKFAEFHEALMKFKGRLEEGDILSIAKKQQIDVTQLKKSMDSAKIRDEVANNIHLGNELGIQGTPTVIIGKTLLNQQENLTNSPRPILNFGFVDYQALQQSVANIRDAAEKK